jgi:integrase
MEKFTYKEPKLCKDRADKKWFIRYSVKFEGEKDFSPVKEYGRFYLGGKSLNLISDIKEREKAAEKILKAIKRDLEDGVLIKIPETLKALDDKAIKESQRLTYDNCLKIYFADKGYDKPTVKQERTFKTIESLHRLQFRPYLEKNGLVDDVTKIGKAEILGFLDFYFNHPDPEIRWKANKTYNHKKTLLSTFFSTLVEKDLITINPAKMVKSKSKQTSVRFAVFTKEERDILFDFLDNWKYPFVAAISRVIYYSYIRGSELSRLRVSDFDLQTRKIRVHPDIAKGQKDHKVKSVIMPVQLKEALEVYLSKFEHQPDWYMFGANYRPAKTRTGIFWIDRFKDAMDIIKLENPGKFNRPGLTPYALKHSGVTHFVNDNASKRTSTELYRYLQAQCRHTRFEQTQEYLADLELTIETVDEFAYD